MVVMAHYHLAVAQLGLNTPDQIESGQQTFSEAVVMAMEDFGMWLSHWS